MNLLDTIFLKGWVEFTVECFDESNFRSNLLEVAKSVGNPISGRKMGQVIDKLTPIESKKAHAKSLSKQFSLGAFPAHSDTAHWPDKSAQRIRA